jgi:hypothetical protein
MKTGAVALIDALGFRGIWGRHKPDEVLTALRNTKDWFEGRIKEQFSSQPLEKLIWKLGDEGASSAKSQRHDWQ